MRAFYEELWERLPEHLEPPDLTVRMRWLHRELRAGLRVLDAGCGAGYFTAEMVAAGARVIGVDVAEAALVRARRAAPGAALLQVDPDAPLPLPDETVDLVWASETLEHVADTHLWLAELRRVLVPGGRLLITTPHHPRLGILLRGLPHYAPPLGDHLHLYTVGSLRATLQALHFAPIEIHAQGGAPLDRRMLLARAHRP